MTSLSQLILERNSLPEGNIYKKTINGKQYFYHQYFYNGKQFTKIIKESDVEDFRIKIAKRKEIDSKIRELQNKEKNVVLSKNANKLTGYIMSANTEVAEFNGGKLVWLDEELAPLVIIRTKAIEPFLQLRALDMSRTNARILKKILNINEPEEYKVPLYSYALAINDNYWFKPKHSKVKYNDINFNNDHYSDASLKGDSTLFPLKTKITPEITTTGSYEKGWKLIDGSWWLYKAGTKLEYFSELVASRFAELMGINSAYYEMDKDYIRTKNFVCRNNFEPLAGIAGSNDDYDHVFNLLYEIDAKLAKQYLKLIFFDAVVFNVDRHNENLGFLRNSKSGKIISLAPNFDNNLSLLAVSPILMNPQKDAFIASFLKFLKNNAKALVLFKRINFPFISHEKIFDILYDIPIKIDDETSFVTTLLNRYIYILTNKILK